jgi:DNA-binding ferritin-like protein (Dps family)
MSRALIILQDDQDAITAKIVFEGVINSVSGSAFNPASNAHQQVLLLQKILDRINERVASDEVLETVTEDDVASMINEAFDHVENLQAKPVEEKLIQLR